MNITETFHFMAREIKEKVLTGDESLISKDFPKGSKIRDQKPKEVEVPVVVEVREHRNTAKSGGDDGGR